MPRYTLRNNKTGEEFILEMKISELDPYLEKNPHIETVPVPVFVGDAAKQGITKPPSDFQKYVLGRIKDKVPGAKRSGAMERRYTIPREI